MQNITSLHPLADFQGCGVNKFTNDNNLQIINSTFIQGHGLVIEVDRSSASIQTYSALECKDSDPQCCLVGGAMRIITSNAYNYSSDFFNNVALSGGLF